MKRKTDLPSSANSTILRINGETFTVKEINEHMGNTWHVFYYVLVFLVSLLFTKFVNEAEELNSSIFQNTACTR